MFERIGCGGYILNGGRIKLNKKLKKNEAKESIEELTFSCSMKPLAQPVVLPNTTLGALQMLGHR